MSKLRGYQISLKQDIYQAWSNGIKNILGVLPTGGGKTVVMGEIAREFDGCGIFIAHRSELLSQISTQLAREGVYHNLITPKNSPLRRKISDLHLNKVGKNYINDRSQWLVGGVDTVINMPDDRRWKKLGLMITDEGHHLQKNNKWGEVFNYATNAKLLAFTATPRRADGRALDIFEILIEGVPARWLIDNGYLVDYRIVCPRTSDLDLSEVSVSSTTGDYNATQVKKAMHASKKIVGDVVREYLTHAKGKLGITFAVDVEEAVKISKAFNDAGVPAEVISAKTPLDLRSHILSQFANRKLLQLVNVDLFGEGFDLPAVEVVSFARPTMSFALYCQQFGRVLRLMINDVLTGAWDTYTVEQRKQFIAESKKPFALIIDHVANVITHHFPDSPQKWSLEARERKSRGAPSDSIPLRSCLNIMCMRVYEKCEVCCPFCGQEPPLPAGRTLPEQVDGDLQLLTENVLAKMRGDIANVDGQCHPPTNLASYIKTNIIRNHMERQAAQKTLRETIGLWAGKHNEHTDRINHKRFFLTFGITVLEAKALNIKDAGELEKRIMLTL